MTLVDDNPVNPRKPEIGLACPRDQRWPADNVHRVDRIPVLVDPLGPQDADVLQAAHRPGHGQSLIQDLIARRQDRCLVAALELPLGDHALNDRFAGSGRAAMDDLVILAVPHGVVDVVALVLPRFKFH